MKKIIFLFLLLVNCESIEKHFNDNENEDVIETIKTIRYVADTRTDFCFAIKGNSKYNSMGTLVPCTKEVCDLLIREKSKNCGQNKIPPKIEN